LILFRASIPMPPSLNNAFLNVAGKGRVRSKAYKAWAEEAGWMVKARMNGQVSGPVSVLIDICPRTRRAFDLDNRCKPALDLLVSCGVLADDSNKIIKSLTIREVSEGPECTISLEAFA
jgi:Holliday junction resolvase RusA-like endonuclease